MKRAIRDPRILCRRLNLPAHFAEGAVQAAGAFPLFAPLPFVQRMTPGDPDDPLLRQVLPIGAELRPAAGFSTDPVADQQSQTLPGVIRKYPGRALLIVSGSCAVHCRYCFRRHFPYHAAPRSPLDWQPIVPRAGPGSTAGRSHSQRG